jgi:hypothetical protein
LSAKRLLGTANREWGVSSSWVLSTKVAVFLGVVVALRVTYERDMKVMNAATFTVEREDHTVGNVIRMYEQLRG